MERIILVRHGQTNKNVEGIIHAFDDEESLNNVGIEEVTKTAQALKEFSPLKVYCSKGKRAQESGQIIAQELGVKAESIEGMEERNWGDFTGKKWEEVEKVLNPMTIEERYLYHPPHGESWQEFETRLIKTVNKILLENKGQTIVIVSHGGAIRALMPYLLSVPKQESFRYSPNTASITIFNHNNGKFFKPS